MQIKIKRDEMLVFELVLNKLKDRKGTKFQYAIMRTLNAVNSELKIMKELMDNNAKLLDKFNEERMPICEKYADKDENGKPISKDNKFQIEIQKEEFDKEMAIVVEKYKSQIEEFDKNKREILSSEVEIDVHQISVDDLPSDLTGNEVSSIKYLIKD